LEQAQKHDIGEVILDKYRVIDFLGEGGLAYNYLARMLKPPYIKVVIKQTKRKQELNGEISEDRFQMEREYRLLSELNHPGIPRVFEIFEIDNVLYFAREYRDGTMFTDLIESGMHPTAVESAAWHILNLLDYLHDRGLVYRDLKPSNLLLDNEGRVFLFDFGTARFHKPGKEKDTIALGTPGFAAPEQYGKKQTDTTADIYSFGAVVYYMMTGDDPEKRPFEIGTEKNLKQKIHDPQVRSVLKKCLELDPVNRYESVYQLRQDLKKKKSLGKPRTVYMNVWSGRRNRFGIRKIRNKTGAVLILIALFLLFWPILSDFTLHKKHRQDIIPPGKSNSEDSKENLDRLVSLGVENAKKNQWEKALEKFEFACKRVPESLDYRYKRGVAYYHLGDYEKAIKDFNFVIETNPRFEWAYAYRGWCKNNLGEMDSAISDLDLALKIRQWPAGYMFRGLIYLNKKKYQTAIGNLEHAIKLDPEFESAYSYLALVYMYMGEYEKAVKNIDTSINLAPRYHFNYLLRGWLDILEGREQEAITTLEEALYLKDNYSDPHTALGFLAITRGEETTGLYHLNMAISRYPANPDPYYIRALYYYKRGEKDEVSQNILKAVSLDKNKSGRAWFESAAKYAKWKPAKITAGEIVELIHQNENTVKTF